MTGEMEAEDLLVLYDYDYDYKEKKISVRRDEKLKLLQRTNQHWWKVVRPGVNKAFFVPAQYVQVLSSLNNAVLEDVQKEPGEYGGVAVQPHEMESSSPSSSPEIESNKTTTEASSTGVKKSDHNSSSSMTSKMKRGDSTRASKKAMKVKSCWSASLEELSKQIKFPGISSESESVMNLSFTATVTTERRKLQSTAGECEDGRSRDNGSEKGVGDRDAGKKTKPIPLPRKCLTDALAVSGDNQVARSPVIVEMTPKPIPKVRCKYVLGDGGSWNKSSGGSSEVLSAMSSSEELLAPSSITTRNNNYKEESVLVRRNRYESTSETPATNTMKPKELRRSPLVISPVNDTSKPRKPFRDEVPIRPISENWSEYMTAEKRFYYYNSFTGATSWKPPRGTSIHRQGDSSLENSNSSLTFDSETLENNNHVSILREEEDSTRNGEKGDNPALTQLSIPVGWSYVYDGVVGQGFYVNDVTGARWLSSQDPEGKIYYYEENSTKSSWFLPVPGISLNDESSSNPMSKSTTSDSLDGGRDVSPRGGPMPDVVTTLPSPQGGSPATVKKRHSTGEMADRLKTRSMLILPDSRKAESSRLGSLPRSQQKSIWNFLREEEMWIKVIREGLLSRTKITENGKKVRKNWASAYVVLTEEHLSLFKDEKSFGSKKSELEIELGGSTVDWSVDKTSRKHVFQLNTSTDLQVLFQAEDPETTRLWIEDIQEVIKRQPVRELLRLRSTSPDPYMDNAVVGEKKSSRLGRAKSTKLKISGSVENLTSEEKNKIRAQLKKFFNRRPGRESLVKKGIYKDEAVFGCLLEKLCHREGKQVPNFVQEAITAIESKDENLKTDGIYRASGNLSQVQKIRFQVDQNNLLCLYQEEDVHVLAGALKLFFREMREPLIPSDLFTEALNASNLYNKKEKIGKFRDIVGKLGKPNRATLHALLKHLLKVSEYSEFNRMLIPNLAIVFGPTLMWPAHESTNMALDLMQQNFVIEALLLDFELIFEKR